MNEDHILNDLDDRARAAVTDLRGRAAARPAPAFDPDRAPTVPLAPASGSGRSTGKPWFAAVAAVAVMALLAAGLWFGTRDDGDSNDVADQVVSGSIQPYLPTVVPDGMELAGVGESDGSDGMDPELNGEFGPLTTFGPAVDDPRLAVTVIRDGIRADSSDLEDSRPVAVGDRTGFLAETSGLGGLILEVPANEEGDGPSIILFGPDLDEEVLVQVARGVTVDGLRATVAPDSLPEGWQRLATEPTGLMALSGPMAVMRGSFAERVVGAYYGSNDPERFLTVSSAERPGESLHTQRLVLDGAEMIRVRGHQALIGYMQPDTVDLEPGATATWSEQYWSIQWMERPGEMVSLGSLGLTRDELVAAAESLEPVEPTRWKELLEATALGDLEPSYDDGRPSVEMGRGRFDDGTAWVLRYTAAGSDESGSYEDSVELDVAISGDSSYSSSFSEVGTAIDGEGNPIEVPAPVFRSTGQLEKAGRAFASGLVRGDVTRVEVRAADGSVMGDAELVTAEGQVAWVVEVTADASELVAYGPDGTELGTDQLPGLNDGSGSSDGGGTSSGGEPVLETTIPAPGPTTTGG